jgi:hypothetical protein
MPEVKALSRDTVAGLVFFSIGGLGLYIGSGYRVGTALNMGPGYIPRLLCWLLVGLGVLICIKSLLVAGERMPRIHLRPLAFVIGSLLLFALLLVPAGLLLAGIASIIVASFAAQDSRPLETALLAVGLTVASGFLFVVGLGLPIRLLPW